MAFSKLEKAMALVIGIDIATPGFSRAAAKAAVAEKSKWSTRPRLLLQAQCGLWLTARRGQRPEKVWDQGGASSSPHILARQSRLRGMTKAKSSSSQERVKTHTAP